MATKSSFWLRGKKGRLAGTTVYTSKGRTIQREIVDVANPQTRAQMEQRVKWPNLVNFYKVMKPVLKYAFENKKQTQSDYNALMSINASRSVVPYITKSEARQGFVAHAAYQVTQGTLPSVTSVYNHDRVALMSNIIVPASFVIDGTTTIAAFSAAIIENNPNIREGMQLSLVGILGGHDAEVSNVHIIKNEVILSLVNTEKVMDYMPDIMQWGPEGTTDHYLACSLDDNFAVSACFIISETISGKTRVSTESMVLNELASIQFEATSSSTAQNDAILSYGVAENAFLNSTEANKA